MRVLYTVVSLFFSSLGLLGFVAFDYFTVNRHAQARGEDPISFVTYVGGWVSLGSALAEGDAAAAPMPEGLVAMLPRPPEGWAVAPAAPEDVSAFLVAGLPDEALALISDAVTENPGRGLDQARQTYTQGPRSVIIELVRYPDMIFTSLGAMALKMELEIRTDSIPAQEFMWVRGLEVREARLPEGAPARVFLADVGTQIHLRVTAPVSMTDHDLLPFFETLHVPAMNADVVETTTGLGEVPVIVLASVMDAETRKLREAERAAEAEARAAELAAAEAERAAAEAEAADAIETDEGSGVKLRKGAGEEGGNSLKGSGGGSGGFSGDTCRTEGGRKVCGGLGD